MDGQDSLYERLSNWASRPFTEDMDVVHWALLTVLVVTVAYAWFRVLRHIGGTE